MQQQPIGVCGLKDQLRACGQPVSQTSATPQTMNMSHPTTAPWAHCCHLKHLVACMSKQVDTHTLALRRSYHHEINRFVNTSLEISDPHFVKTNDRKLSVSSVNICKFLCIVLTETNLSNCAARRSTHSALWKTVYKVADAWQHDPLFCDSATSVCEHKIFILTCLKGETTIKPPVYEYQQVRLGTRERYEIPHFVATWDWALRVLVSASSDPGGAKRCFNTHDNDKASKAVGPLVQFDVVTKLWVICIFCQRKVLRRLMGYGFCSIPDYTNG